MKRRWAALLLMCLMLTGCSTPVPEDHLIPAAEGSEGYCSVLPSYLSGYAIREAEDTLYAEVARGNAVACFDVQAIPAMDRGVGRY